MTDFPAETKRCTSPEHAGPNPLPITEFSRDARHRDGLQSQCRACTRRRVDRWAQQNRAKVGERGRRRRQETPEKIREWSRRSNQKTREADRAAVLGHYGRVCACPGCGSTEDLAIDHVNGDGEQHRAQIGGGSRVYRWLIANGFPDGFQTLCRPCNASKHTGERCRLDHTRPAVAR